MEVRNVSQGLLLMAQGVPSSHQPPWAYRKGDRGRPEINGSTISVQGSPGIPLRATHPHPSTINTNPHREGVTVGASTVQKSLFGQF